MIRVYRGFEIKAVMPDLELLRAIEQGYELL